MRILEFGISYDYVTGIEKYVSILQVSEVSGRAVPEKIA